MGTIMFSEPEWEWGQGEMEVVFLLNGPAINSRAWHRISSLHAFAHPILSRGMPYPIACLPGVIPADISASLFTR